MMRRIAFLNLIVCLFLTPVVCLCADDFILHLKNGDKLTGHIVSETDGILMLDTVWQKGLVVPIDQIESRAAVVNPVAENKPPEPPTEQVPVVETPKPPLEPGFWSRWKGDVQVGLDISRSEKNRELWYGRTKLTYGHNKLREIIDYQAAYGKTDGILSANRMDGSTKTDWDLSTRSFAYNLALASYDELRKIDYHYEVGPGLGYRIITGTNYVLNGETGFSYTETGFANTRTRTEANWRIAEDFTWNLNSKLNLEEKLAFTPKVDDMGAYRIRFESTLKFLLMKNLSLNLSMLNLFDSRPAPGVSRNDLQIRSTVGFSF